MKLYLVIHIWMKIQRISGERSEYPTAIRVSKLLLLTFLFTTFTIEMSPPIYFHYAGSIQPILKNKKSFKNYEKLSNQL